jgi:hypothetical protein
MGVMTIKTNSILLKDSTGQEIYLSDVDYYVSEYIETLPDESLIYKPRTFQGLLQYIYQKCLKDLPYRKQRGLASDYELLDGIFWGIYCPLSARYGATVSVFGFANFVHISMSNLADIRNGVYRKDGYPVAERTSHIVKEWYEASQASIVSNVLDSNSIGGIFILKSAYHMTESPQQPPIDTRRDDPLPSIEDVEARYMQPPKLDD